LADCAAKCCLT